MFNMVDKSEARTMLSSRNDISVVWMGRVKKIEFLMTLGGIVAHKNKGLSVEGGWLIVKPYNLIRVEVEKIVETASIQRREKTMKETDVKRGATKKKQKIVRINKRLGDRPERFLISRTWATLRAVSPGRILA